MLALAVMVSHVSSLNIGRPGVVLFFMLSGYWVSRLYEQRGNTSTLGYLRDRILRVWPLLAFVAVGVVLFEGKLGGRSGGSLWSTLGLLGLAVRRDDVIGVAWSLDIELQFYILLPLTILAVRAVAPRRRTLAATSLLAIAFATGVVLQLHDAPTVLLYAPAFGAGALIWFMDWTPSGRSAGASVAVFAAMCGLLLVPPVGRHVLIKAAGQALDPWWHDLVFLAVCMTLAPFIAWNVHQRSTALDRHLGNLSFPLYLLHFPIIRELTIHIEKPALAKLSAVTLSLVAALLLYVIVDRPIERARRHLRRHPAGIVPDDSPGTSQLGISPAATPGSAPAT